MFLEILGFCVGILYLWWEYHANPKVWLASVIMPMISMWIYFSKGLYADFGINIYYLVIAIYGFWNWTRKSHRHDAGAVSNSETTASDNSESSSKSEEAKSKHDLPVSHTPLKVWAGIIVVSLALWWLIWWILTTFTDSTVPVADAFTTALSIVGLWMMAKKYAEQWLIWLIVDLVCSCLYWYKGIPFYSVLYVIYTVIAWFGYRKWVRLIPSNTNS